MADDAKDWEAAAQELGMPLDANYWEVMAAYLSYQKLLLSGHCYDSEGTAMSWKTLCSALKQKVVQLASEFLNPCWEVPADWDFWKVTLRHICCLSIVEHAQLVGQEQLASLPAISQKLKERAHELAQDSEYLKAMEPQWVIPQDWEYWHVVDVLFSGLSNCAQMEQDLMENTGGNHYVYTGAIQKAFEPCYSSLLNRAKEVAHLDDCLKAIYDARWEVPSDWDYWRVTRQLPTFKAKRSELMGLLAKSKTKSPAQRGAYEIVTGLYSICNKLGSQANKLALSYDEELSKAVKDPHWQVPVDWDYWHVVDQVAQWVERSRQATDLIEKQDLYYDAPLKNVAEVRSALEKACQKMKIREEELSRRQSASAPLDQNIISELLAGMARVQKENEVLKQENQSFRKEQFDVHVELATMKERCRQQERTIQNMGHSIEKLDQEKISLKGELAKLQQILVLHSIRRTDEIMRQAVATPRSSNTENKSCSGEELHTSSGSSWVRLESGNSSEPSV